MRRVRLRQLAIGTQGGALPWVMAAVLVSAGSAAVAQEEATATEASAAGPLQEVTVTATRRAESLSKVPISVTALTQESMDDRGVKDFADVARFTPGVNFDNSGTNNISIRGISGTGGAGTTGIYLDDTPIQMRALAFNPDEALPKSFDIDRIEVLRGPQGTLFGAGSEGGTVRYISTQPSLSRASVYSREEVATTENGDLSYEAGAAVGGPLVQGVFGARVAVSYRHDGGWIDRINPVSLQTDEKNANFRDTLLIRLSALWAPSDNWTVTPSIYYQDQKRNDIDNYWPLYSNPAAGKFINANPSQREVPDKFYIAALKVQADLSFAQFISNTSYFHRQEQTGYEGTLYNLGFYQVYAFPGNTLLDGTGVHLPAGVTDYRSPSSIDNHQENITQELRLQSNDPAARLLWTGGVFLSVNRQSYLEQIHDPMLNELSLALAGVPYTDIFTYTDASGNTVPATFDPNYPNDAYFLKTHAKDEQYAVFGELTYGFTEHLKATLGARFSKNKYSFETLTGGPQLYAATSTGSGDNSENSFTPKASLQFQADAQQHVLLHLRQGVPSGRRQQPAAGGGLLAGLCELRHHGGAGHLQFRHGQQLRGGSEEQYRWLAAPGEQPLLHQVEQHPADRHPAHLPDLVHRQPRSGGGQGCGSAGRYRRGGPRHYPAGRRLHGCALHGRFAPERRQRRGTGGRRRRCDHGGVERDRRRPADRAGDRDPGRGIPLQHVRAPHLHPWRCRVQGPCQVAFPRPGQPYAAV